MIVSTASTWQKNGRTPLNSWERVLKQPGGLGRHPPLIRARYVTPLVDGSTELVDDPGRVVLLLVARDPLALVKDQRSLRGLARLAWLGDRRDEDTGRRVSKTCCVGWPVSSSSQYRDGYRYGELRIGCSKKSVLMTYASRAATVDEAAFRPTARCRCVSTARAYPLSILDVDNGLDGF